LKPSDAVEARRTSHFLPSRHKKPIFFGFIHLHSPSLAFIGTFIDLDWDGLKRRVSERGNGVMEWWSADAPLRPDAVWPVRRPHEESNATTQRRQDAARPAATKEFEQEHTEKTEAEKLCQKCATFRYSAAKNYSFQHFGLQLLPPSPGCRPMRVMPFAFSLSNSKFLCVRCQRENADFSGFLQGPGH